MTLDTVITTDCQDIQDEFGGNDGIDDNSFASNLDALSFGTQQKHSQTTATHITPTRIGKVFLYFCGTFNSIFNRN